MKVSLFVPTLEDLRILEEEFMRYSEEIIEVKCYSCGSKTIELVRVDDGEMTQNRIRVCVNPECVMYIDCEKVKGEWVMVGRWG